MRTYYALSTENFQEYGYSIFGVGSTKEEALAEAAGALPVEITYHKNLVCVSKSEATRRGWVAKGGIPMLDECTRRYYLEF